MIFECSPEPESLARVHKLVRAWVRAGIGEVQLAFAHDYTDLGRCQRYDCGPTEYKHGMEVEGKAVGQGVGTEMNN